MPPDKPKDGIILDSDWNDAESAIMTRTMKDLK
eukprot:CAMPEP_0171315942 /NCGR_PEP_ID=MMETSP0816-20121228/68434_1 /TAXON_ID=420281 /ORGANISM="Proboscia inermis, Strain CCAP1064/1" /LENGTH=32 /DNA_ID= /DNA_START= /DNA_END= /DNA_ORIENTATION=